MSWEKMTIGDVCKVFDGPHATPPKSEDGPVYLGITSIRSDGSIDYENSKRISYEDYPKWTKRVTPQFGDVVFSYEANLESYAMIPAGFEGCLGRRMAIMRPDESKIRSRFLYFYMFSPRWKGVIAERTVLGATVNRIPIATYPEFPIAVPSLDEQDKIVELLGAYDDLIDNSRRQIKLLEEAAQRLYRDWFVDMRFPGHEGVEIVDGLPEGWRRARISDAYDVVKGCSYTSSTIDSPAGIPMITLASVKPFGGYKPYLERNYSGKHAANQILCAGDVVMALTEQAAGLAGYTARIPKYADGYLPSMDLVVLRPKEGTREYLYASCTYGSVSRELSPLANGTKIKHLKPEVFGYMGIVVPPVELQRQYSDAVSRFYSQQDILYEMTFKAIDARNRLLPKLMSGEIEV